MRKDLLLRGAELLEADALNPEGIQFNLGTWATDARINLATGYRTKDAIQYDYKKEQAIPVNCRTQACAFGLFAISGAFKDEGLSYVITEGKLRPMLTVGSHTHTDWDAVITLFDISVGYSWRLFSAEFYKKDQRQGATAELAVAARIRQLVANDSLEVNEGG